MKSVTGIQATLAQTERERLLARAASRGSICIPLSRGYRSQTPREITREEIFGIEWAIMRLHLNNLRGVDWAQVGAGVEIERSRGALGFAVADRWRCRSSAWLRKSSRCDACSLGTKIEPFAGPGF